MLRSLFTALAVFIAITLTGCGTDDEVSGQCVDVCSTSGGSCYGACESAAPSLITRCEAACAKECSCGTNVCGDLAGGASAGCVRSCAGLTGSPPSSNANINCRGSASCQEILNGTCAAMR